MKEAFIESDLQESEETESTEKIFHTEECGRFEILLDIVKVNTNLVTGEKRE